MSFEKAQRFRPATMGPARRADATTGQLRASRVAPLELWHITVESGVRSSASEVPPQAIRSGRAWPHHLQSRARGRQVLDGLPLLAASTLLAKMTAFHPPTHQSRAPKTRGACKRHR